MVNSKKTLTFASDFKNKQQIMEKNIRISENACIGTSHNGMIVYGSTEGLTKKLGLKPNYYKPDNIGGKTTREWDLILQDETPFTIYDWKEYRSYDDDETVEWHIGTRNKEEQEKVRKFLSDIGIMNC